MYYVSNILCVDLDGGDVEVLEEAESGLVGERSLHQLRLKLLQVFIQQPGLKQGYTV